MIFEHAKGKRISFKCACLSSYFVVYGNIAARKCTWKILELFLNCTWFFKKNLWPPCKLKWITGTNWKIQKVNLTGRSNIDIIIIIIIIIRIIIILIVVLIVNKNKENN